MYSLCVKKRENTQAEIFLYTARQQAGTPTRPQGFLATAARDGLAAQSMV